MPIINYKPTTAGRRNMSVTGYSQPPKKGLEKSLLEPLNRRSGRNSYGRITARHRGGENHKRYRVIDFRRQRADVPAKVPTLECGSDRSAFITLIQYESGQKSYIIAPHGLKVGDAVVPGTGIDIKPGNVLLLSVILTGTSVHNVELYPGKDDQLVRSAGSQAQLMAEENGMTLPCLSSGELRNVPQPCMVAIDQVSNLDHENVKIGKAGYKRHMGWRSTIRRSAINPNDHLHDGGKGKSPVDRPDPVTSWGKPTLGYKTHSKKNRSDRFIVRRRNSK